MYSYAFCVQNEGRYRCLACQSARKSQKILTDFRSLLVLEV